MIDLELRYLKLVREILASKVPMYGVWVFGSRVTGSAGKYSDIDLVLMAETKVDRHVIEDLKDAFSESDLPIQVDVCDWWELPESLRMIVASRHEVLQ